jgi:hypothetical protein
VRIKAAGTDDLPSPENTAPQVKSSRRAKLDPIIDGNQAEEPPANRFQRQIEADAG